MNFVVVTSVVFLCFVGWSYGYLSPAVLPANILNSLHNAKRSALERRTRQSDQSLDDIIRCASPGISIQCESDFQPRLIQNAINCGQNALARYIAGSCDRNPSGEYCALVALQRLEDFSNAIANCASFVEGSACPSGCASQLQSLRNSLGCCINSVFNLSIDASEVAGDPIAQAFQSITMMNLFTYPLWSSCNVQTVGTCESSATVTPIHNSFVCTTLQFTEQALDIQCNSADAQRIVDATITAGGQCYEIGQAQALTCSSRSDGQYCSAIIAAGSLSGTQAVTPTGITLQCNQNQQSCSSGCRSAIEAVSNNLGCCFNSVYNTSLIGDIYEFEASNALWNQCGIGTPGICESTLDGSPATTKAMSLLVLAVLAALVQYIFV